MALAEYLKEDYIVLFMDFQEIGTEEFQSAAAFARAFGALVQKSVEFSGRKNNGNHGFQGDSLRELFVWLSGICADADQPVVLMIDEADSASNNQVFIDFLALLRRYYIDRDNSPIFYSVILTGVYDIKNLKLKLRPEENHSYNSPWNIAARFHMDMSFSAGQIVQMLQEYEADRQTGMDICAVADCIYAYTGGYPFLVSVVCKLLDEEVPERQGFADSVRVWSKEGILEAVRLLLNENLPLFDSMVKQLESYRELREMIQEIFQS